MDNKYLFLSDDDLSKVNGGVKENDDAQGEKHCPECHVFLDKNDTGYHCPKCGHDFDRDLNDISKPSTRAL